MLRKNENSFFFVPSWRCLVTCWFFLHAALDLSCLHRLFSRATAMQYERKMLDRLSMLGYFMNITVFKCAFTAFFWVTQHALKAVRVCTLRAGQTSIVDLWSAHTEPRLSIQQCSVLDIISRMIHSANSFCVIVLCFLCRRQLHLTTHSMHSDFFHKQTKHE